VERQGASKGIAGDTISRTVQVVQLAHSAEYYAREGIAAAVEMARRRAGIAHAPDLVEHFCRDASTLLEGIDHVGWTEALDEEPTPHRT
jgi:hypothetical protein